MTFVNQKSRYVFPQGHVTVTELRAKLDEMCSPRDEAYVAFGFMPDDDPTHAGSLILEVTSIDIFGNIKVCTPVIPEVSVPQLRRRHRDRKWADADGLVWYAKDGSWHCDDLARELSPYKRGPFRQVA